MHGKTGFIVNGIEEAVDAVHRISSIERRNCRGEFDDRFTDQRMAQDYARIYERQLARAARAAA